MTGTADPLAAVVLAGGRSSRLGGQDKATLLLDGARLVDRAVAAARAAGAACCVVVGPDSLDPGVPVVREDPPFGGPVAGLAAGLAAVSGPTAVLVLACDLADPASAVGALVDAWSSRGDAVGVHLVDERGHPQWLTGIYRRDALDEALAALGDPAGQSARRLLSPLPLHGVEVGASAAADIDTWEDLRIARHRREGGDPDV